MRLIWEGDHLSPPVREAMDALEELESESIAAEEAALERVEIAVEVARLNSVDGPENSSPPRGSRTETTKDGRTDGLEPDSLFQQIPSLKRDLSGLSHRLDGLAAEVDSVRSCGDADVKRRKKRLSNVLVRMMERVDSLIVRCEGGDDS